MSLNPETCNGPPVAPYRSSCRMTQALLNPQLPHERLRSGTNDHSRDPRHAIHSIPGCQSEVALLDKSQPNQTAASPVLTAGRGQHQRTLSLRLDVGQTAPGQTPCLVFSSV